MFQAKRLAKDAILKSGEQQEEWVVERAMYYLPMSWKLFLSKDQVRKIVRWLFQKSKDYLNGYGKYNSGGR